MNQDQIPPLTEQDIQDGLTQAHHATRRRYPRILHEHGDVFNRVFNFMKHDSYMQPHLHPGDEKIEKIYLIRGQVASLFFDDQGTVQKCVILEKGKTESVEVPAFSWHTYVMLSESVITYETMMGVYQPKTWKKLATWAPAEGSPESIAYLQGLKEDVAKRWQ